MSAASSGRVLPLRERAIAAVRSHRFFAAQVTDEKEMRAAENALAVDLETVFRQPLASEPPEMTRVGLGYRATFAAAGVEMTLERVRESRGEVHGELTVCLRRGATDFADGHLYGGRFNVSSLPARTSAAKYLDGRVKGDWAGILERFCLLILREERRGETFEMVGQRPRQGPGRYLVSKLLPLGVATILFGAGGTGKSTLAATFAVAVATGQPVVRGWEPTSSGPVLALDWEDGPDTWNDRSAAIAAGIGAPAPAIHYRAMSRPLADDLEAIAAYVTEHEIRLVIVDSLGLATGATRDGESVSDGAFRLFAALRELGTTSLLVDHVAGADLETSRATAKPYGSVYKLNLARSAFELRREREGDVDRTELMLLHTKSNAAARMTAQGLVILRDASAIRFERTEVEAPELVAAMPLAARMAHVLRAGAQPVPFIADELGVTPATLRSVLHRDRGQRFSRLPDGRVGLVEP